jgi:hypothetical protein
MTLNIIILYTINQGNMLTLTFLYTDPGSGALLWQLLVASFFGGLFYARSFIRRVMTYISRRRSEKQNDQETTDDQTAS